MKEHLLTGHRGIFSRVTMMLTVLQISVCVKIEKESGHALKFAKHTLAGVTSQSRGTNVHLRYTR